MGIFDVVKEDLKAKSLNSETVINALRSAGINTSVLQVSVTGENVILSGTIADETEKGRIVKIAAGIEGVKSVSNNLTVQSTNNTEAEETVYTVKTGDTLGTIAKHFYGNSSKYTAIFEHNKQVWTDNGKKPDANMIFPGWNLKIPKL